MKNRFLILALLMASGCGMRPAFAQKPSPEPTELEKVKLENYVLKINMLQQQAEPFIEGRVELIRQIIAEHPGYTWHEAQHPGETTGLVPIPKEPAKTTVTPPLSKQDH